MSTPDQPQTPPLTRRQLREIRNTGATPVLTPEDIAAHAAPGQNTDAVPSNAAEPKTEAEPELEAEEPEAGASEAGTSEPAEADQQEAAPEVTTTENPPARVAAVAIDASGAAPLTRRQAREFEKIRTASVPVITQGPSASEPVDASPESPDAQKMGGGQVLTESPEIMRPAFVPEDSRPSAVVNPHFGSGLLAGEAPAVELPPSFDHLIARNGSGVSSSTPNALILSQAPAVAPLVAPVTATGEVLITGSFDLPEGLGSVGHAPGVHDGKEADAVLIDGELPAASSPTPIAASAAISQVRSSDEIIRPPAPDKSGRLSLILGLATGALALAAISTLVFAVTRLGL